MRLQLPGDMDMSRRHLLGLDGRFDDGNRRTDQRCVRPLRRYVAHLYRGRAARVRLLRILCWWFGWRDGPDLYRARGTAARGEHLRRLGRLYLRCAGLRRMPTLDRGLLLRRSCGDDVAGNPFAADIGLSLNNQGLLLGVSRRGTHGGH